MTKFKIYTESEKFVWTRKRILFGIALLSFVILAIKFYLIKNAEFINDSLAQILGFISVSAIFLGLINSFFPQELKGKLNGELIFDFSKIVINNDSYNLEDIKSIQIITGPFKGQLISSGMSAFSDRFSNGINNELIIKSSLPNSPVITFTDGLMPGDISMGDVKQNIDTDSG